MMTYDQAKVFELITAAPGPTYSNVVSAELFDLQRTLKAISELRHNRYVVLKVESHGTVIAPTDKGKEAYKKWSGIPF